MALLSMHVPTKETDEKIKDAFLACCGNHLVTYPLMIVLLNIPAGKKLVIRSAWMS